MARDGDFITGGCIVAAASLTALALLIAPAVIPALWLGGVGLLVGASTPTRRLVPIAYLAMSAVYVQAAIAGVAVDEIPLASRYARDGLLIVLVLVLAARSLPAHPLRGHLGVLMIFGATCLLFRAPFDVETIAELRYLVLVPAVGMLAATALAKELGTQKAITQVSKVLVWVATMSAVVGLLQVLGFLNVGYYADYVTGGRSVGIVGQPNNQAFLLVLGVVALRNSGAFRKWTVRAVSIILTVGVLVTYSRTGIIALVLVWLLPVVQRHRGSLRRLRGRPITVVAVIFAVPPFVAARGEVLSGVIENERRELALRALNDLGPSGIVLGKPSLTHVHSLDSAYVTDNAFLDLLIVGGITLLFAWVWLLVQLWKNSHRSPVGHGMILAFVPMSFTASVFGLFPGVLFLWTLLFLVTQNAITKQRMISHSSPSQVQFGLRTQRALRV